MRNWNHANARRPVAGGSRAGRKPGARAGADPCRQGVLRRTAHRQGRRRAGGGHPAGGARPGPPVGVARRAELDHALRISAYRRRDGSAWMSAPRPGASPTCCWPTARPRCMRSMSATVSSRGSCGRSARRCAREDQRPLPDARRSSPTRSPRWCATPASSAWRRCSGAAGTMRAGRLGGGADQAAVRGRTEAVGSKAWCATRRFTRRCASGSRAWWAALPGWRVLGITESPITGPEGNREFLIAAERLTCVSARFGPALRARPDRAARSRPAETTPSRAPSARPDHSAADRVRRVSGGIGVRHSSLSSRVDGAETAGTWRSCGSGYGIGSLHWITVGRPITLTTARLAPAPPTSRPDAPGCETVVRPRPPRAGHAEQFEPRGAGDRDDRPCRLVGQELPRLALQFQPVAQAAPFAAVGILDEHREDAGPVPAQPLRRDGEQRRRTATATSFARPARAAIANMPSPAAVTDRCASGPNSAAATAAGPTRPACAPASSSGSSRSTAAAS